VAEDTFGFEMFVQMGIAAPMAAVMIFIIMLGFFRSFTLVLAPMVVAMATVLATMGLLIACGFTVHIMSSMIAIFLMPIAVVDSVHIMSEFADRYKPGQKARDVAEQVVEHLFRPMLFTSVTSTVGFLSLTLTPIPPVQVFGAFVGFGIMLAFVWTILFVPAYISRMSSEQLAVMQQALHRDDSGGLLARGLKVFGVGTLRNSRLIMLVFAALFVVSILGIQKIQINDNPVRWFKDDHRIRIADKVLNEHFAGTYDAHLTASFSGLAGHNETYLNDAMQLTERVEPLASYFKQLDATDLDYVAVISQLDEWSFELDGVALELVDELLMLTDQASSAAKYFLRPETLAYVEGLQQYMQNTGFVGKSNAVTDLVKTVNRELRSGKDDDYQIPQSQAGVSQALLQFQSSHRPGDLWHMVNPDYSRMLVWVQLKSGDNQDMSSLMEAVDQYVADNPLPEGMELRWAGKTFVNVVWQDAMVAGMADSLMSAFVVVFVMMVLLFRSFLFGLLAMLPLTLTITFIYGLIGWVGKDYDMPIAVLSALTLGLSVDFAIHFLERAREQLRETGDFSVAMQHMFGEPASAISRNALVIALGFTPLLFAPLTPYVTVGIFLASIMAASGLVTLMVLPAALKAVQPWIK
jgi:predicted RND superfamily exporter protein